jgi:hypothetical protein
MMWIENVHLLSHHLHQSFHTSHYNFNYNHNKRIFFCKLQENCSRRNTTIDANRWNCKKHQIEELFHWRLHANLLVILVSLVMKQHETQSLEL